MTDIHPNDRTYALERAIALAEKHDPSIVHYLRVLLDEAKRVDDMEGWNR